jgi:pyruvate dehydrogenase E2 component (dihydrolipoamide acetyltransferase)
MEEGTVVEWLKHPGDSVKRGDIIAVVETVKGAIEIETFQEGMLDRIVAPLGATVAVGEVLAYIDGEEPATTAAPDARPAQEVKAKPNGARQKPQRIEDRRIRRISPAARRRAEILGIDIQSVNAAADGVVGVAEVEAAVGLTKARPEEPHRAVKPGLDLEAMRGAIGAAMARSKREIPHYYVTSTLDLTPFLEWLEKLNAERGVADRLLYAAPLIKAIALALKESPTLNGVFENGAHKPNEHVHVGIATALRGGGLIAPAIHDPDTLTPDELMLQLRDLVARVRSGRIRGSEMSDPTVTLSILGEATADSLQPVIYPPQVAIIGCGAIRERPWALANQIAIRRVMTVTVAGDHRVSDGRAAGRFVNRLDTILQNPEAL